jgi:flagellar basal body-associated protein FliL
MTKETLKQNPVGGSTEGSSEEAGAKRPKKLMLAGGVASVMASAGIAAMLAIPSRTTTLNYAGPFSHILFEEQFTCNIEEDGHTRFLQMKPVAKVMAYDSDYMEIRTEDELYAPEVENAVFSVASTKTLEEIYGDINKSTFSEELRDALDPVLFPVHIGDSRLPWDIDSGSGLRPGLSSDKNSFRGRFHEHALHVNAVGRELWIDDGPKTPFDEGGLDVRIVSSEGDVIFVDTSGLEEGFVGKVKLGVKGQIKSILPIGLTTQ